VFRGKLFRGTFRTRTYGCQFKPLIFPSAGNDFVGNGIGADYAKSDFILIHDD
jgi:hypothetical protein